MKFFKPFILMLCTGVFAVLAPLGAKADEWNKETVFTFKTPVELPDVVLQPGTYVFKLADSMSNRDIVQVFNKNQTHIYDTFLAASAYRLNPTDKAVVTFEERATGAPQAIRYWFYPGDNFGQEFLYRHVNPVETANLAGPGPAVAPAMSALQSHTPPVSTPQPATSPAPSKAPTQMARVIPSQPPTGTTAASAMAPLSAPKRLPKTASPLGILLLGGLLSLAGSAALQIFAKRPLRS